MLNVHNFLSKMSSFLMKRLLFIFLFQQQNSSCFILHNSNYSSVKSQFFRSLQNKHNDNLGARIVLAATSNTETDANDESPKRLSAPLFIDGPSEETKPNYDEIYGPLGPTFDKLFLTIFRSKMAEKVGIDSKLPKDDYQGLMELTSALNARFSEKDQVRQIARSVLSKSIFFRPSNFFVELLLLDFGLLKGPQFQI